MLDTRPIWSELTPVKRLEILEPYRLDRMSSTNMAKLFQGATRNSVIGLFVRNKVQLMGPANNVAKPSAADRNRQMTQRRVNAADERAPATLRRPPPDPEQTFGIVDFIPVERRLTLLQLNEHTCKWPEGDPLKPDFHFCGAPSLDGKPYCKMHDRRSKN